MIRKIFKKGLPRLVLEKKGFSLVELLVVITIIAILSVAAYTAVGGNTVRARDAKRKQDIGTIQQALELYYAEKGSYPTAPLTSGTGAGQVPKKYLSDIPKDPGSAKHDYVYVVSGSAYEMAATLENDGAVANFESYVAGNSDTPLVLTAEGLGRYNNAGALTACANSRQVVKGKIGTSDTDGKCVPYDPNN